MIQGFYNSNEVVSMLKKMSIIASLMASVLMLVGCETARGVTKDVSNTARNVADIFKAGKTIHDVTK